MIGDVPDHIGIAVSVCNRGDMSSDGCYMDALVAFWLCQDEIDDLALKRSEMRKLGWCCGSIG